MTKKHTTEQFIQNAKAIWGNRYIYDQVHYINATTPVTVICPIEGHGPWPCLPHNHTRKNKPRGCGKCGGSAPITLDEFLVRARAVHGDKYIYDRVKIINSTTNVMIGCSAHNPVKYFPQTPDSHFRGSGCRYCRDLINSERRLLSEDEVNERLALKSESDGGCCKLLEGSYKGQNKRASIVCSIHGNQEPRIVTSILKGKHPCLECSGAFTRYSTQQFKKEIEKHFDGKNYRILPFEYENKKTTITLVCPNPSHDNFSLLAESLKRSPGCPVCSRENSQVKRTAGVGRKLETTEQKRFKIWLSYVNKKYDGFYDYSKVQFEKQKKPVKIICPVHGEFPQTPADHKNGGCRDCKSENTFGLYSSRYFDLNPKSINELSILYYIRFRFGSESWYKVGITRTSIAQRFSAAPKSQLSFEVLAQLKLGLKDAWDMETLIQKEHGDKYRYKPKLKGRKETARDWRLGPSECFSEQLTPELLQNIFLAE